ncbi:putative uncharacterized protein DDB_G0286901 [Colletes gigas]|uniref:putative uncharacterized protein DDB_G0286901 n=1 Tax=Colletes gigas TaxID=935657 RepID=UPI001C9ABC24|nr:putative uncharacterized protein DDB_G0286901 [Colletes gigas]
MTRYARSKGSKASNEKVADEPTPWHVMKQQLAENLSKKENRPIKNKSAKELLQDKQDVFYCDVGNVNNDWAEFEDNSPTKSINSVTKEIKKKQKTPQHLNKPKKNKNVSVSKVKDLNKDTEHINNVNIEATHSKSNEIRKQIKRKDRKPIDVPIKESDVSQIEKNEKNTHNVVTENDGGLSKRQKRNMRKQKKNSCENTSETDVSSNKQKKKFKNNSNANKEIENNQNNNENRNEGNDRGIKQFNNKFTNNSNNFKTVPNKFHSKQFENNRVNKRKLPKIRDDKEHKRRKADLGPTKMVINGIEIEIVKFDGFPVKKEDAERLGDLKQKMIIKGIPKKEIDIAMKLERRKAEKALARIRRCVCFHCRKAGHNLSDCPELGVEQAGTGICFKCGSTEHTHFECRVAKPTEFRYATCFICREQGHIAKQCPDNPKGVYPQGGSCKVCGDVTHLKKDCPDLIKEKEENTITVNSIANDSVESLEENVKFTHEKDNSKSKKVVKF